MRKEEPCTFDPLLELLGKAASSAKCRYPNVKNADECYMRCPKVMQSKILGPQVSKGERAAINITGEVREMNRRQHLR